ncbi:hypothetical protein LTR16_010186, partial [Cryomyces antarcticus]
LGPHPPLPHQPLLRLDRANRRPDRRPIHVVHRLPRLQRARLCQQIFPLHSAAHRHHHARRLPDLLGLGVPARDSVSRHSQARRAHQEHGRHLGGVQSHGRHPAAAQHPPIHRRSPDRQDRLPSQRRRHQPQAARQGLQPGGPRPHRAHRLPLRDLARLLRRQVVLPVPAHEAVVLGLCRPARCRRVCPGHSHDLPDG